jgi:hypothetical protein
MRTRRIRQPLVTGNAERRHVPRPGNFVPKRGTGTRRDEAWYDGGTRIGGKQDGRAKVKPRACLGLPLLPPAPAAGATLSRMAEGGREKKLTLLLGHSGRRPAIGI